MDSESDSLFQDLPKELRPLLLDAERAMSSRDYTLARSLYQMMVEKFPDYIDGWYGLTRTNLLLKSFNSCAECYIITKNMAPDFDPFDNFKSNLAHNPELTVDFAAALAEKDYLEEALRYLDYVIALDLEFDLNVDLLQKRDEIDKKNQEKQKRLYEVAKRKKRKEEIMWAVTAVIVFTIVLGGLYFLYTSLQRATAETAYIDGKNFYRIGENKYEEFRRFDRNYRDMSTNYSQARLKFEEAVKVKDNFYRAQYMLAKVLMRLRDIEFINRVRGRRFSEKKAQELLRQAKLSLQRAVKYNPQFPEAYLELGIVYFELMDWDQAIDCCEKAINLAGMVYADDEKQRDGIIAGAKTVIGKIKKLRKGRYKGV